MKNENINVVVVSCPPCGENVALATKRGAYKAISLMSPSIGPADHFLRKGGRLAFTLIELLVVVLIIGILAAVAVPQYKKAVYKTRYATLKTYAESLANAETVYYLANGSFTENLEELDIELSGGQLDDSTPKKYVWDDHYCLANISETVENKISIHCVNTNISMGYTVVLEPQPRRNCYIYGSLNPVDFPLQHQICKNETGLSHYTATNSKSSPQSIRYQY